MKLLTIALVAACLIGAFAYWNSTFSYFRDSLPGRDSESDLPRVAIEDGSIVYCRMRADDFRFPLPPNSTGHNPKLESGGPDTVEGTVSARFQTLKMTAQEYLDWASVKTGGHLRAKDIHEEGKLTGLLIKFSYFGDR